jgi:hypothetical protein
MVHPFCFLFIGIVLFRRKDKVWCKIRVPKQCMDAQNYVPKIQLAYFLTDQNLFSLEGWTAREVSINQFIKLS